MKIWQVGTATALSLIAFSLMTPAHSQTTPADLKVSAATIDFGKVAMNSDAPPQTITVSNPTRLNITLEQIITSGIDFSEKHDCGHTLPPGAQCTIQVFFKPVISGPRTGNLDVMGSDVASPHFIGLTGIGT